MAYKKPDRRIHAMTVNGTHDDLYRFVKVVGGTENAVQVCDSQGEEAFGILETVKADAGGEEDVCYDGITKIESGASITAMDVVTTDANGRAMTTASSDYEMGIALESASGAGEYIPILLFGPAHEVTTS